MQNNNKLLILLIIVLIGLGSCIKNNNFPIKVQSKLNDTINAELIYDIHDNIENDIFITDYSIVNGTWLPERSYFTFINRPEEDKNYYYESFSWGEGKSIVHATFEIDVTAEKPFIRAAANDSYYIAEINFNNSNTIKVHAYKFFGEGNNIEIIFHFLNKDTIWIECKDFEKRINSYGDEVGSGDYGKNAWWHRLSGPTETNTQTEQEAENEN